ncbi:hypothetical protein Syun_010947 [Stephania yunnanensis]|uniref:Uncharacterized protein n=1 Tax=Stephania yunnanensis TaxID=152371 RepID=A0AAP0PEZ1_9MAGN
MHIFCSASSLALLLLFSQHSDSVVTSRSVLHVWMWYGGRHECALASLRLAGP